MKALGALLAHEIRRSRALVLAVGFVLGVFQVLLIFIGRTIQDSRGFEQMAKLLPPFMREIAGPALAGFLSFQGVVCLGYFHLATITALIGVAISQATTPVAEIESGLMDLQLSRPIARHSIITRTVLSLVGSVAVVLALMIAGTWSGLNLLAPPGVRWPAPALVHSLAANLGLLALAWGAVAMAMGAGARRRGPVSARCSLLALVTFLLDYVARAWKPARSIGWLSPFRYFDPMDLLLGKPLLLKNVLVLAAIFAVCVVLSYAIFSRRDVSS